MAPQQRPGKVSDGPSLEALFGGLLGWVPGYLFMESIFGTAPHPAHWVGAVVGAAGGYGLGALVAAYKDERTPFGRVRSLPTHRFRPGPRVPPGDRAARTYRRTDRAEDRTRR